MFHRGAWSMGGRRYQKFPRYIVRRHRSHNLGALGPVTPFKRDIGPRKLFSSIFEDSGVAALQFRNGVAARGNDGILFVQRRLPRKRLPRHVGTSSSSCARQSKRWNAIPIPREHRGDDLPDKRIAARLRMRPLFLLSARIFAARTCHRSSRLSLVSKLFFRGQVFSDRNGITGFSCDNNVNHPNSRSFRYSASDCGKFYTVAKLHSRFDCKSREFPWIQRVTRGKK